MTKQSCLETVSQVLDELQRCSDPVVGAARMVMSKDAEMRSRGLVVLRGLDRAVQSQPVDVEVSVAEVLSRLALKTQEKRSNGEQCAIWMSLFVLGFRNCNDMAMSNVIYELYVEGASINYGSAAYSDPSWR